MAKSRPMAALRRRLQKAEARAVAKPSLGPGTVVGGRYALSRALGQGAFGAVFLATDTQRQEPVAVKVLHPHVANEEVKLRLLREAHVMSQLADTCAVDVHEVAETDDGRLYLVMDFLDGQDLARSVTQFEARGGTLSAARIVHLLQPIAQTLHVAHQRAIIHRDLKPENIFVLRAGGSEPTRLLDFGLAKDMSLEQLTAAGMVAGSPSYIAPEAWAGDSRKIDHRVDVYALGVIVFRLLAGTLPFEAGDDLLQFVVTIGSAPRPRLTTHRPDLPPSADAWTERALAARRDDRFASVEASWSSLLAVFAEAGMPTSL